MPPSVWLGGGRSGSLAALLEPTPFPLAAGRNAGSSGRWRLVALAALLAAILAAPAGGAEVEIFGWAEPVILEEAGYRLDAKLDTGADTSSLDAIDIKRFRRKGVSWVRFTVEDHDEGDTVRLERPLLRRVRIKRHDGDSQRRSVISLTVCLGDHRREVEFSLIDRSQFDYPVLLGRSALAGIAVVDPDVVDLSEPDCGDP